MIHQMRLSVVVVALGTFPTKEGKGGRCGAEGWGQEQEPTKECASYCRGLRCLESRDSKSLANGIARFKPFLQK